MNGIVVDLLALVPVLGSILIVVFDPREIWAFLVRTIRTVKAVIGACRKHLPKWLGAVLAVALAIPGPQDELLVLLIIAGFVLFKPVMRTDVLTAIRTTWNY